MPFIFQVDDKQVNVDDMPLSLFAEIESATGVAWYDLTTNPMRYAAAGEKLAVACAKHLGVECPPMTPKRLVEVFKLVKEESRPTEWTDGMPDPKAKDSEPETT